MQFIIKKKYNSIDTLNTFVFINLTALKKKKMC